MKRYKSQKMPTVNIVILTTLVAVALVFALMVILVLNFLFAKSIERAKIADINDANGITISLRENLNYISQLLRLTQESLAVLDYGSDPSIITESSNHILTTMLSLTPEVHCAWLIFEKGVLYEDGLYIRELVQHNGAITESYSIPYALIPDSPDSALWYFTPLTTGEIFLDTAVLYKYANDEESVYAATISMPVSSNGVVIGVCGVDILYNDILGSIRDLHSRQNRNITLLSQDMTILYSSGYENVNGNLIDLPPEDIEKVRAAMDMGEAYSDEMFSAPFNGKAFLYFQPISVSIGSNQESLYLQIGTPLGDLNGDAYSIMLFIVIAGIVCMLLITGIIFFNANRLVKPVKELSNYARQFASSDFKIDALSVSEYDMRSNSETAVLWRAFHEMLHALQDNLRTVENRVEERTRDLQKLNNYVKLVVDQATNIFMLFDSEMNMLFCSSSVLDLLGLQENDYGTIINKPISTLHKVYPDQAYAKRSDERFARILSGEDMIVTDDVIDWPGKGIRSFHITYRRILDYYGKFDGIILTLLDVTDVRIEEAEHRISDMLTSSSIACFIWDEEGTIVAYNRESAQFFGLPDDISPEAFDQMYCSIQPDLQPDGEETEIVRLRLIRDALDKGFTQVSGRLEKSDGTHIYVNVTVARIAWMSGYRLIAYFHDTTEVVTKERQIRESAEREREAEIQKESALASNKAKSAFLANMSHEIRTPMNSIMGFSELAMEEAISEKAKEYLSRITENSKGLLQIVNDILDISKIESGSVELEIIPFDLHELLTTCKSAILPIALEKNIELYFYAESSIRRRLYGDPTRLRQVLFNLLSNAIKFTEAGKVSLYAGILDSTGESVTIRFRISDSGIGMTPEQISRIFEPFMQADISTTRKYGGTGLGLPITKSILDLMHSDLEIESTPGAGTIISFTLTLDAAKETEDHTESADAVNDLEKPTFHADVLVCEDNRMNQQVIIGHLSRVGLDAEIAENGLEGVEKVEQRIKEGKKPFDLIFMDIHMPVMDGLEATSRIIKLNTRVPIVAMTANIMTEDRETYKALGMDHYIGKPFSSQELWQCLLKYLKPEHTADADDDEKDEDDDVILQKQLMAEFARSNQNRFSDISRAIASSDLTLAHRLAHNLKSNAGLIGKQSLRNAAADVERVLADGSKTVKKELMDLLQNELSVVLEELRPYLSQSADPDLPERAAADIGMSEITEIFKALEPLLRSGSPESLKLLGKLRVVPGTGQMIEQMEDFRFGDALKTFNGLKEKLGIM